MTMEKGAGPGKNTSGGGGGGGTSNTKNLVNENCYVTQTASTVLESLSYYYGCISREDAEWILYDEGCPDGMFLLRESGTDLVLSLCHHNSVLHYRINKLSSGDVVLQGLPNQRFTSPMELIDSVDGLACKPSRALKALHGKCLPPTHWHLAEDIIREQLILRAPNWGLSEEVMRDKFDCDLHFSATFSPIVRSLIVKSLHELQPWYHYRLSRADAERRIEASGHQDGKFLVRERDESSYAICLSHESRVKHYRIDILPSGNFAIQDGPKFESIIALVSHYTIFSGGLWCMLGEACPRPQEMIRQLAEQSAQINNQIYASHQLHQQLHHNHGTLFMNGHGHHHHLHHHHHHAAAAHFGLQHQQSDCSLMISPKIRSRSIERYGSSGEGCAMAAGPTCCKVCLKTMQSNRRRRVSTPTNAKLKEWFTTINHKWAQIKRQVILHHQRQQPLINEDNYGTCEEFTCCQVKSSKMSATTTPKTSKVWQSMTGKTTGLVVNGRGQTMHRHHQLGSVCAGHHQALHCPAVIHRYANGFGIYGTAGDASAAAAVVAAGSGTATCARGFGYRRQQFGKWPEEPIFGSRYAFEMEGIENGGGGGGSATKVAKTTNKGKLDEADKEGGGGEAKTEGNKEGPNVNRYTIDRGTFMDTHSRQNVSLIKSSSIDTIAGLVSDPLEEVRRLHMPQSEVHASHLFADGAALDLDPFACLECATGGNVAMFPLQRTNSFDNASAAAAVHCNCNCSDWMADFDANDPFGALDDSELEGATAQSKFKKMTGKDNVDNDTDSGCAKSTLEELANIFTPVVSGGGDGKEQAGKTNAARNEEVTGTETASMAPAPPAPPQQPTKQSSSTSEVIRPSNPPPPPPTSANFSPRPKSGTLGSKLQQQSPKETAATKGKHDNLVESHYRLQQQQQQPAGRTLMTRTTATANTRKQQQQQQQQHPSAGLFSSLNNNNNTNNPVNNPSGTSSGSSTSSGGSGGGGVCFGANSIHSMHSIQSSGSGSSSSSSSFTGSSSNNTFNSSSNRSFTATTTSTTFHSAHINSTTTTNLSAHSGSLSFNGNLMDPFGDGQEQHRQQRRQQQCGGVGAATQGIDDHPNMTTPSSCTTSTISIASCLERLAMSCTGTTTTTTTSSTTIAAPVLANGNGGNENNNQAQIIDLLKEFDVCFPAANDLDDHINSSFLAAEHSSHLGAAHRDSTAPVNQSSTTTTTNILLSDSTSDQGVPPTLGHKLMSMTPTTNNNSHNSLGPLALCPSTFVNGTANTLPAPTIAPPAPPSGGLSMSTTNNAQSSMKMSSVLTCPSFGSPQQQQQQQQQQVPSGDIVALGGPSHQQQQHWASVGTNGLRCEAEDISEKDKLKDIELICLTEQADEVQETIKKYRRGPICFDPRCISLKRRIGNGYFGDVFLAAIPCTANANTAINLAVKMLKSHAVPQQKAEILREAQTMAKLDHRHIVRLIGVCEGDPFMLVMELAPLGPLNKYLQNYGRHTMGDEDILRLMLQVARAMQYLEEMNYVHRDLAARNILLVNERFAKVSDFGMSRALGQDKDYYKARSASKWPLKWYAPECIYYYKFSSKSDVWSYGVALWEAVSRGEMPYQGMDGQDILRMFAENRRLPKPDKCSVVIYQIMWSCWQFKPEERLNFATISEQLAHYLNNNKQSTPKESRPALHQAETESTPTTRQLECLSVG